MAAGTAFDTLRSPAALARFLLVAAVGVAVDLGTKAWAFEALETRRTAGPDGRTLFDSLEYEFIPGFLHFKVTGNYGAVFGIGQGQRFLFLGVSLLAIGFLVYLFAASTRRQRFYQIILGMLLAGVIGNMYDRLTYGFVRDMIYALPKWDVFPWIFNVADTLLCVGVGLMLVYSLFVPQPGREDPVPPEAGAKPAES